MYHTIRSGRETGYSRPWLFFFGEAGEFVDFSFPCPVSGEEAGCVGDGEACCLGDDEVAGLAAIADDEDEGYCRGYAEDVCAPVEEGLAELFHDGLRLMMMVAPLSGVDTSNSMLPSRWLRRVAALLTVL